MTHTAPLEKRFFIDMFEMCGIYNIAKQEREIGVWDLMDVIFDYDNELREYGYITGPVFYKDVTVKNNRYVYLCFQLGKSNIRGYTHPVIASICYPDKQWKVRQETIHNYDFIQQEAQEQQ